MQRRSFSLVSALTLALSSGAALGQPPQAPAAPPTSEPFVELLDRELDGRTGLTSAEAAERAVRTSPELARSAEELREASTEVDRALAGYVPEVRVAARYRRLSNPGASQLGNLVTAPEAAPGPASPLTALVVSPLSIPVLENEYVLEARLSVPVSDYVLRVAPRHAAAQEGRRSANENLTSSRLRIATDARVAYYDWVRARLGRTVAERALSQLRARSSDVEQALAIGTASRADLLRVDAEVAQSELLLTSAQNEHAIREQALATLLHDPEGTSYTVGEDVRQPLGTGPQPSHEQLLSRALAQRRELTALDHAIAREQSLGRAERAGLLPRLDLFAGAQYANPNPRVFPATDEFKSSWDAGAQLSWTFSDIPAALADTARSDARAQALAADRRRLLDQITNQVFTAARTLEQSESAIKSAARGLAAAEESYRMRQILYQNGQATTVELLDAEAELTRARFAMLDTQIDARVAAARLEYALGATSSELPR